MIKFPLIKQGKVRDIYEIPDTEIPLMLIHTTNRISAFDVVLPTEIPNKGVILNKLSLFWFEKTSHIVKNHVFTPQFPYRNFYAPGHDDVMLVKKLTLLPIEAVVRGYLSGSGWKDYQETGQVCGMSLPKGLQQSSKLPEPIYTPSTKAEVGKHDQNITFEDTTTLVSPAMAKLVRNTALMLYNYCATYAHQRGIILADTKFEFGVDNEGTLHLIDEMCTPDSSRYWLINDWKEGINPPSLDKQYVRNYLLEKKYTGDGKPPKLPKKVVDGTTKRYNEIYERLTQ